LLAILSARPASLALTISMTIFFYHALLIDPTWVSWWLGGGKQVFQLFNDFFLLLDGSAARRIRWCLRVFSSSRFFRATPTMTRHL
jgi:hypothetical protein